MYLNNIYSFFYSSSEVNALLTPTMKYSSEYGGRGRTKRTALELDLKRH